MIQILHFLLIQIIIDHRNLDSNESNRSNLTSGLGLALKCHVCESISHLMRDFPHKKTNNIVLFTGYNNDS